MLKAVAILAILIHIAAAESLKRVWHSGTLFRVYQKDEYQVYEIDTNDTSAKRCVILVKEKRQKPFHAVHTRVGKPIRYAFEGNKAYLLDDDGSEREALKGPQKLMARQ